MNKIRKSERICNKGQEYDPLKEAETYIRRGEDKDGFIVKCINPEIVSDSKLDYYRDAITAFPLILFMEIYFPALIDATYSKQKGRYINDGMGKERNSVMKRLDVDGVPHLALFAMREIQKGEEIRYDYGETAGNLPWRKKPKHDQNNMKAVQSSFDKEEPRTSIELDDSSDHEKSPRLQINKKCFVRLQKFCTSELKRGRFIVGLPDQKVTSVTRQEVEDQEIQEFNKKNMEGMDLDANVNVQKDEEGPGSGQDNKSELVAKGDNAGAEEDQNKDSTKEKKENQQSNELDQMDTSEYDEDKVDPYQNNKEPEKPPDSMDLPEDIQLDDDLDKEEESAEGEDEVQKEEVSENMDTENIPDEENKENIETNKNKDEEMSSEEKEEQSDGVEKEDNAEDGRDKNNERQEEEGKEEPGFSEQESSDEIPKEQIKEEKEQPQGAEVKGQTSHDTENVEQSDMAHDQAGQSENNQEEAEGTGTADSEQEEGHQGQSSSRVSQGSDSLQQNQLKIKPGKSDVDRSLGSVEEKYRKLKTTDTPATESQHPPECVDIFQLDLPKEVLESEDVGKLVLPDEEDIPPPPPSPPQNVVPALPPNWKSTVDSKGKTYYYNVKTRQTQWTPPTLYKDIDNHSQDSKDGDTVNESTNAESSENSKTTKNSITSRTDSGSEEIVTPLYTVSPIIDIPQHDIMAKTCISEVWKWNGVDENEVLGTIDNNNISLESLFFMRGFLPDEMIDSFLRQLAEKSSRTMFINSTLMTAIACRQTNVHGYLQEVNFQECDCLVGAVNEGQNHWTLLVIFPQDKQICYYNPMGELYLTVHSLMENWYFFIKERSDFLLDGRGSWDVRVLDHSKQIDSISCGVYILKFLY